MKTTFKHIRFELAEDMGSKSSWNCVNNEGTFLGSVDWFDDWNQFVFYPADMTLFSVSCLADIQTFIQGLTQ